VHKEADDEGGKTSLETAKRSVNKSPPITDSVWFWVLLYSFVPLIGLALLNAQYAKRQSRLERQFQGHMAAAERNETQAAKDQPAAESGAMPAPAAGDAREYSSPENTIIPLTPLVLLFLAIAGFAAWKLSQERRRLAASPVSDSSTDGNLPS
jgi:hypothetical protein